MYQLSIGNLDILLLVYDTWEVKKKKKIWNIFYMTMRVLRFIVIL